MIAPKSKGSRNVRTQQEIVARISFIDGGGDFFGTQRGDLLDCVASFEAARPFLRDSCTEKDWADAFTPTRATDRESILAWVLEYMPFAWEKANDCRGLSAVRSLDHFRARLWLLGGEDSKWADRLWETPHSYYGKPHLRAICEHFGWDWKSWDSGRWHQRSEESEPVSADAVPGVSA